MTIANTASFTPINLTKLHQAIQAQGLIEDLGVRPSSIPGQVIVYALHGASSWPYERTVNDAQVDFDIAEFLNEVAAAGQEIETRENHEVLMVVVDGINA